MGVALVGALAGCLPSEITLNRPALRASAARTIAVPRIAPRQGLLGGVPLPAELEIAEVADPAVAIRDAVTQALARSFALEVLEFEDLTPDLVLEIQTTGFTVGYAASYGLAADPSTVVLTYDGTLKLKDARTNEVLAEGTCSFHPANGLDRKEPARGPGTLREQVRETIEHCSDQYRHQSLGLY
jgi:hypothetical protein